MDLVNCFPLVLRDVGAGPTTSNIFVVVHFRFPLPSRYDVTGHNEAMTITGVDLQKVLDIITEQEEDLMMDFEQMESTQNQYAIASMLL